MHYSSELDPSQQHEPRIFSTKLKVAVVRKHVLGGNEYEYCDLTDISHGGIGLRSPWLNGKVGQKLILELYYEHDVFATRGVITSVLPLLKDDQYGIAFIYAPAELDRLIEIFKNDHASTKPTQSDSKVTVDHRFFNNRVSTLDVQVLIKFKDSCAPFTLCQVDNISKGGIGVYAPVNIHSRIPFEVSIQISNTPKPTVITGKVHHMSEKIKGFYYGIEFETITLELASLLDQLNNPKNT